MNANKNISRRFSAAASTYSDEAVIQDKVAGQLIQIMKNAKIQPLKILELGCGTGLLTRKLSIFYPKAHITAVDISEHMILQARKECAACKDIEWITADAIKYGSGSTFDMITSSSALHWMQPIRRTLSNAFRHLNLNGQIYFGMMTKETLNELHKAKRTVIPDKTPRRPLPSADSVLKIMHDCGFSDITAMTVTETLHYKDMRTLLDSLHKLGVTGGGISGRGVLLTASELKSLIRHMDDKYGRNHIPATYQVLYVSAKRLGTASPSISPE
jgi:malonyl-CoA O-methyltransferase